MDFQRPTPLTDENNLLQLVLQQGLDTFAKASKQYSATLSASSKDADDINRRLLFFLTGFTSMVFEGQPERIIKSRMQIVDSFIFEPNIDRKLEQFQNALTEFIYEHLSGSNELSLHHRLRIYLSKCSLSEFRNMTVASLAMYFGYHPDYFTKKIKMEANRLPSEILRKERLNRAKDLIHSRHPNQSYQEIANTLGFQDHHYFRRLLKQQQH